MPPLHYRREDVKEVLPQIRVLVKDTAKKLHPTNDCLHSESPDDTTERPDHIAAQMASIVMSKFQYSTSLRSVWVTVMIICFYSSYQYWASPYSPRALIIYILRHAGAPAGYHPFAQHPWHATSPERGIAYSINTNCKHACLRATEPTRRGTN